MTEAENDLLAETPEHWGWNDRVMLAAKAAGKDKDEAVSVCRFPRIEELSGFNKKAAKYFGLSAAELAPAMLDIIRGLTDEERRTASF